MFALGQKRTFVDADGTLLQQNGKANHCPNMVGLRIRNVRLTGGSVFIQPTEATVMVRLGAFEPRRRPMFRKIMIVVLAITALGAVALPTAASARWHGGWHGGWRGPGW